MLIPQSGLLPLRRTARGCSLLLILNILHPSDSSLTSLPLRWRGIGPRGQQARAQLVHCSGVGSSTGPYPSLFVFD
ncbi:uncharacterized protein G2W53_022322 [Senna tora]|uniref:Uncharacterized protein n=1 Tax=Senna tora TaxID=362788 RepID=A0A834WKD4_9FABA|nr:uncharacterized protein G2W53_022322 [Senna tora]